MSQVPRVTTALTRSAGSSGSVAGFAALTASTSASTRAGRPAYWSPSSITWNSTSSADIPGNSRSSALTALHLASPRLAPSPVAVARRACSPLDSPIAGILPHVSDRLRLRLADGRGYRRRPERFFFLRGEGGGAFCGRPFPPSPLAAAGLPRAARPLLAAAPSPPRAGAFPPRVEVAAAAPAGSGSGAGRKRLTASCWPIVQTFVVIQ